MVDTAEADAAWNSDERTMSFHWPSEPGRIEITSTRVTYDEGDYRIRVDFKLPSPRPTGNTRVEIERPVGNTVGSDDLHTAVREWEHVLAVHNGEVHEFRPGWYTFWVWARNCNDHRCVRGPLSVVNIEVEDLSPPPHELVRPVVSVERRLWNGCHLSDGCLLTTFLQFENANYRGDRATIQARLSRPDEQGWPIQIEVEVSGAIRYIIRSFEQGEWYVQVRYKEPGSGPWSEWSRTKRVNAEPTSSDLQSYGSRPGAPRNVMIRETGGGRNARWKLSWDPPSDFGGWLIKRWRYADTGPSRFNGRIPGRSCGDSHWPDLEYHVDNPPMGARSGDDGREFGVIVPLGVRPGWTISISAVNAEGEGECTGAERN